VDKFFYQIMWITFNDQNLFVVQSVRWRRHFRHPYQSIGYA